MTKDELKQMPDRYELLLLFRDFFTYHNDANKDYEGIDDLFNDWYDNKINKL